LLLLLLGRAAVSAAEAGGGVLQLGHDGVS